MPESELLDNQELMLILMEECAEVTQAISKIFRFGLDTDYNEKTNRERLEEEVGDLLCCVELLISAGVMNQENVTKAKYNKILKLKKWSNLNIE